MMGEPIRAKAEKVFLSANPNRSYYEAYSKITGQENVECRSLDSLFSGSNDLIDFLKIDVEGGEGSILQGARNLLSDGKILFVKSEFLISPIYKDMALLGKQHEILNEYGLLLIDLDFKHPRYTWGSPSKIAPIEDRQFLFAGDAYFVKDPDRHNLSAEEKHRLGVIALVFGFYSFSCNMFREAGLLTVPEIESIERSLSKSSWKSIVHRMITLYPKRFLKRTLKLKTIATHGQLH